MALAAPPAASGGAPHSRRIRAISLPSSRRSTGARTTICSILGRSFGIAFFPGPLVLLPAPVDAHVAAHVGPAPRPVVEALPGLGGVAGLGGVVGLAAVGRAPVAGRGHRRSFILCAIRHIWHIYGRVCRRHTHPRWPKNAK